LLADWVAGELLSHFKSRFKGVFIDPACGDGALLKSLLRIRPNAIVAGIDIDPTAIRTARRTLPKGTKLQCADALHSVLPKNSATTGWDGVAKPRQIVGVISNPPWGAALELAASDLRNLGYSLAVGQFDSFDLFLEMSLKNAPTGAMMAFIVPDSLFLPEHKRLRSLLLAQTKLHLVARLGEGFFSGVFRGTAVVICEKGRAATSHRVECFRLKPLVRRAIFSGTLTLQAAKNDSAQSIPQALFAKDRERRFVIDVKRADLKYFAKISARRSHWTSLLVSGRGVELSKHGNVLLCPKCEFARPVTRNEGKITCLRCDVRFFASEAKRDCIITKAKQAGRGWKPLIVGEDVTRYRCASSRAIRANVGGINYKNSALFKNRKLLVRKTGVGLNAAIDESGALTNQVVFHYTVKACIAPDFFLDYVLGIMCSRIMLAYHLVQSGESEWRSHPYVTQKVISELPIPIPEEGTWEWRQARSIASAVTDSVRGSGDELQIDRLVAGLYGLDKSGCAWALGIIDEAEPLQDITSMRAHRWQLEPVRTN
jgi:predicted RNA methylase